jgi:hypothetical protein
VAWRGVMPDHAWRSVPLRRWRRDLSVAVIRRRVGRHRGRAFDPVHRDFGCRPRGSAQIPTTAQHAGVVVSAVLKLGALFLVLLGLAGRYVRQAATTAWSSPIAFCVAFPQHHALVRRPMAGRICVAVSRGAGPDAARDGRHAGLWRARHIHGPRDWLVAFRHRLASGSRLPPFAAVLLIIGGIMGLGILQFPGTGLL